MIHMKNMIVHLEGSLNGGIQTSWFIMENVHRSKWMTSGGTPISGNLCLFGGTFTGYTWGNFWVWNINVWRKWSTSDCSKPYVELLGCSGIFCFFFHLNIILNGQRVHQWPLEMKTLGATHLQRQTLMLWISSLWDDAMDTKSVCFVSVFYFLFKKQLWTFWAMIGYFANI